MSRRRYALEALEDILEHDAYANLRLKDGLRELSSEDAAWISALVYETLEHLYLSDFYIAHAAKGRLQPKIRNILRMGVCELLFMRTPPSAACNESVKLCKEIGKGSLSGYVNGVLRSIGRLAESSALPPLPEEPAQQLSLLYGYPQYLVSEYIEQYGFAFTEAMLSYKQHGTTLRAQPPFTCEELQAWLDDGGFSYRRGEIVPQAFHIEKGFSALHNSLFQEGKITVQSESAMLVCRALGAKDGWRILDACAAPGGKSAYISALTEGKSSILAWDIHPHRVELIRANMKRLQVENVESECRDASAYDETLRESFDAVLLDVPCSGLGLPDKPDLRYKKTAEALDSLAALQASILDCCCRYVRLGGVLLYATCTVSQRENEAQIAAFLKRQPNFQLTSLAPFVPASMQEQAATGMLQLFPQLHHTEGFFIARMEKRA